jgi:hypothetical protein
MDSEKMLPCWIAERRMYSGNHGSIHVKKRLAIFPSLAGMSLTKLSQAGHN